MVVWVCFFNSCSKNILLTVEYAIINLYFNLPYCFLFFFALKRVSVICTSTFLFICYEVMTSCLLILPSRMVTSVLSFPFFCSVPVSLQPRASLAPPCCQQRILPQSGEESQNNTDAVKQRNKMSWRHCSMLFDECYFIYPPTSQ